MRHLLIGFAVVIAAFTLDTRPASAQQYPWCLYSGKRSGGGSNCGFVSFEQCLETLRGIGGICMRNSFYVSGPANPEPRPRHRAHRRH
jgi:hypothetical protein